MLSLSSLSLSLWEKNEKLGSFGLLPSDTVTGGVYILKLSVSLKFYGYRLTLVRFSFLDFSSNLGFPGSFRDHILE